MVKALNGVVVKKVDGRSTSLTIGRPEKYTKEELEIICADFQDYINRTADPTVVGFTSFYSTYPVNKAFMTQRKEFSNLVRLAIDKQEAYLMAGATQNKLNATFAIFRLKQPQHGWTDKSEVDNNISVVQPILGGATKKPLEELDALYSDSDDPQTT